MNARTVFVMLYLGAFEGSGVLVRPSQILRMSDLQSKKVSTKERIEWRKISMTTGAFPNRWYADGSREGVRDESIGNMIPYHAVVDEKPELSTTASSPRYSLRLPFVALFDPALKGKALTAAIDCWQEKHLGQRAYTRLMLAGSSAQAKGRNVLVDMPDGTRRPMSPGGSSDLSKAVIEIFAKKFLQNPAVVHLSESKKKIIKQDEVLAKSIGLNIDVTRALPDIVLADLGPKDPLLVFVEVVFSSGAITQSRRDDLHKYAAEAGFGEQVAYVSAFWDRNHKGYAMEYKRLAWGSFVWFMSEPHDLMCMLEGVPTSGKFLHDFT